MKVHFLTYVFYFYLKTSFCDVPLVSKCCPSSFVLMSRKCVPIDGEIPRDYTNISIYDSDLKKTDKTVNSVFNITFRNITNAFYENGIIIFTNTKFMENHMDYNVYLTEKGVLYLESPNEYTRWRIVKDKDFCLDFNGRGGKVTPGIWAKLVPNPPQDPLKPIMIMCASLISSVFLFLVLVVYFLLPELRNLSGMVLISYIFSQMVGSLFLAMLQMRVYDEKVCKFLSFTVYFCFLASFCWMNVMSLDIWWTFRGYAKARPIHRRGHNFKFCMYSLYSWGIPSAMTTMTVIVNELDLKHIPGFVTPGITRRGCFMYDGARLLYLYIPMLILISLNWVFFTMTAYNVWRLSRNTGMLDSPAAGNSTQHRTQHQRFMVYLKLSVVMGINWILEVVSLLSPPSSGMAKIWYISDTYNLLTGLFIFLIFVAKRKIFIKLMDKFHGYKSSWTPQRSRSQSTETTSSVDMPLTISTNPKGA